jgi:hypothetical protein
MIFTVPLRLGTVLANVRYKWVAAGAIGAAQTSGITQPDTNFPVFRISCTPPASAEEVEVYDNTDLTNWNVGGYAGAVVRDGILGASQLILGQLYSPTQVTMQIVPANPASRSIVRCYGQFTDLNNNTVSGDIVLTLIAQDNDDPTIIYDLSGIPLINSDTKLLLASRVVFANLVAGQLQDINANAYLDLVRTDYITSSQLPGNSTVKYFFQCDALGAPVGISQIGAGNIGLTPILLQLNTATIGVPNGGTFNLAAKLTS